MRTTTTGRAAAGRAHRRGRAPARAGASPDLGHEAQVVRGVERVEGRLAVVQPQQRQRDRARARRWRPTSTSHGLHHPGVAGLLAEPDEHVVDEDHADREGEGGRARLLLAPQREGEPEQAEDEAGGGDRELLVPLDREAAPLLARLALRAQLARSASPSSGSVISRSPFERSSFLRSGKNSSTGRSQPIEPKAVRLYSRGSRGKKLCWLPGPSSMRTICALAVDHQLARARQDELRLARGRACRG